MQLTAGGSTSRAAQLLRSALPAIGPGAAVVASAPATAQPPDEVLHGRVPHQLLEGGRVGLRVRGDGDHQRSERRAVALGVRQDGAERLARGEADRLVRAGELPVRQNRAREQRGIDHAFERIQAVPRGVDRAAHPEQLPRGGLDLIAGMEGQDARAKLALHEARLLIRRPFEPNLDIRRVRAAIPGRLEGLGTAQLPAGAVRAPPRRVGG